MKNGSDVYSLCCSHNEELCEFSVCAETVFIVEMDETKVVLVHAVLHSYSFCLTNVKKASLFKRSFATRMKRQQVDMLAFRMKVSDSMSRAMSDVRACRNETMN